MDDRYSVAEARKLDLRRFTLEDLPVSSDEIPDLKKAIAAVGRDRVVEYLSTWAVTEQLGTCPFNHNWGVRWGIVHGTIHCAEPDCGWPGRSYHFIKLDPKKKKDVRFVITLFAHPDDCWDKTAPKEER